MNSSGNVCRTCLRSSLPFLPLFYDPLFSQKITVISSVHISEADNLPAQVCLECVANINLAFNFRKVVITSDTALRRLHNDKAKKTCPQVVPKENVQLRDVRDTLKLLDSIFNLKEIKSDPLELPLSDNDGNGTIKDNETVGNKTIKTCTEAMEDSNEATKVSNEAIKNNSETIKDNGVAFKDSNEAKKCSNEAIESNNGNEAVTARLKIRKKQGSDSLKIVCQVCGKQILECNLSKHMLTHYGEPVTCKICGKTYKNQESIRMHIVFHKSPMKTCEFCGKTFKFSSNFVRHVRKHTGEIKKHRCNFCEKAFAEKNVLIKHIRSHTGERPFPCEFCKKCFSSRYALKTHIRQHTNEKPFVCKYCPMGFPQKVSLKTHIMIKHPERSTE